MSDLMQAQRHVFEAALTSTEKLVLLAILNHWSLKSKNPWPSVRRLSEWTDFGRTAIIHTIASLEEKGAISVTRASGRASRYDLAAVFEGHLPVHEVDRYTTRTGPGGEQDPFTRRTATRSRGEHEVIHGRNPKKESMGGGATSSARPPKGTSGSSSTKKAKRWTRVPKDWQPTNAHRELARELGVSFEAELAKFRDHEYPKAKAKTDADACFSNWLRTAKEFAARGGARRGRPPPQQTDDDAVAAVLAKARQRQEATR